MTTLSHLPIAQFVTHLQGRFSLAMLVETGTFEGESTRWAAERFGQVITIDVRGDYLEQARARCAEHRNIRFLQGDTRRSLPVIVEHLTQSAMFWLDAHATPGLFGDTDDWPALDELAIICRSSIMHCVLIDDAHCFLPGTPHTACPTFPEIAALAKTRGYDCRIAHDVIALLPREYAAELDYFERLDP